MSFWLLVFIFLIIAMIVGPIMLMRPSKRDKRIAALRQKAAMQGMQVRLNQYQNGSVTVYSLGVKRPKDAAKWQLVKQIYKHEIHFYNQWQFVKNTPSLLPAQSTKLKQLIDTLNDSFVGLETGSDTIGIWWNESFGSGSVDEVKSLLIAFAGILKEGE